MMVIYKTSALYAMPEQPTITNHQSNTQEKQFRGWRLLMVIFGVVLVLAAVSFFVDWAVIGPLEGRAL